MGIRNMNSPCTCARSRIPLSSTLLLLYWILPSTSLAQLTSIPPESESTSTPSIAPTPEPSAGSSPDNHNSGNRPFNYYFLIVAVVGLVFCIGILWFTKRRKQKAALMRFQGQRALARDVEGWRGRFGVGRAGGTSRSIRQEGLDERGEAPPPYVPGSKPPSIRTTDGRRPSTTVRSVGVEDVEMGDMRRDDNAPPDYEETNPSHDTDIADIRRPVTAIIAPGRVGSIER